MRTILTSVLVLSAIGCGGGRVNVPEGPMPSGGTYTGVWHSPQYGEMHLTQTGNAVAGDYTKDERHGRIQGSVHGNVLRFEWSEQREMVAGHPLTTRGRGYFRYAIGADGDHYVQGEWGVDDNMTGGGPWNAVRDRRRQLPSTSGSTTTSGGESEVEEFDRPSSQQSGAAPRRGTSGRGSSGESRGSGESEIDLGDL